MVYFGTTKIITSPLNETRRGQALESVDHKTPIDTASLYVEMYDRRPQRHLLKITVTNVERINLTLCLFHLIVILIVWALLFNSLGFL